jgi:flagellar basal body-associated protein FliL
MDEQNNLQQPEKNSTGALIGSIIVIIVLVLGAIYFWGGKLNSTRDNAPANVAETQNEVSDLEADLNDIPEIDVDINSI